MNKSTLRKLYKAKRIALSAKERLRMDELLLLQFQQINFSTLESVLTYWPLERQAEPNTHLFLGFLRQVLPDICITYPVTDKVTNTITAFAVDEETLYKPNTWGIMEPTKGKLVSPEEVDLVLVPMLLCDKTGKRVGYGKGFYDRYLSRCRPDIISIGFSYFEPIDKITDTNQFDVPLTYCITPHQTYEF